MKLKTLYIQIIVAFLSAIVISLTFSYLIAKNYYEKKITKEINEILEESVNVIPILAQHGDEKVIKEYIEELPNFGYKAILFKDGTKQAIVKTKESEWVIDQHTVERVLKGEKYRFSDFPRHLYLGVPFQINGTNYALFVGANIEWLAKMVQQMVLTVLANILFFGSILFFITTHFIVKPIRELTKGTKKLATGDFNIKIYTKRKDELGNLTKSFNLMAKSLRELEDMRREFVSNVSHEIQSPLTSIKGFAKALKDGVIEREEDKQRYLEIIEKESQRLSLLSQNLLKLAALDADHPSFSPKKFYLDEQLRRVVISLEPQWKAKNHSIHIDFPPIEYIGDEDQLEQVWVNLISNAIQYTQENGTIHLKIEKKNDIYVYIQDNGIGISEEHQSRIFERFYKVDKARTRNEVGGNGLGLSIVKKIVQLHNGQIQVKSELGKGSTFTVILPIKGS